MSNKNKTEDLKNIYGLEKHPEGGWFSESYTAPFEHEERSLAGSIYFLLDRDDISHFHQIDCDEVWYYHEGCGLKIYSIYEGKLDVFLLGPEDEKGERAMVVIPKGAVFAAENIDKDGYTFISCITTPKFSYDGFRLVNREEIKDIYPKAPYDVLTLAYE